MAPASLSDVHVHVHRQYRQPSSSTSFTLSPPPLYPLLSTILSGTHQRHHAPSPTYIEDKTTSASPSAIFSSTFEEQEEVDEDEGLDSDTAATSETAVRKHENTALYAGSSKNNLKQHGEEGECKCSTEVNDTGAPSLHSNKMIDGEEQEEQEEVESRAQMKKNTRRQHDGHSAGNNSNSNSNSNSTCSCTAHLHVDESRPSTFRSTFLQQEDAKEEAHNHAAAESTPNGFGVECCASTSDCYLHPSSSTGIDGRQEPTSSNQMLLSIDQQLLGTESKRTSAAHPGGGAWSGLASYNRPEATLYDRRHQMQLSQQQRQRQQQQQQQEWQEDQHSHQDHSTISRETVDCSSTSDGYREGRNLFPAAPPPAAGLGLVPNGRLSSCSIGSQRDQTWQQLSSEDLQAQQRQQQRLGSSTTTVGDISRQSSSPKNTASPSPNTTVVLTSPRTSSLPSLKGTTACPTQDTSSPLQQYARLPLPLPPPKSNWTTPRAAGAGGSNSSAVKANSPLRIITTPLPALSDPDSGGTEVAPRPPPPARQAVNPSSSSSSSLPSDQASRAPNLSVTAAAPMSSSGSSSNEDIPTPTASPYSSCYTGTSSSFPSSVPTTAGTSYPTSAVYLVQSSSSSSPACGTTAAEGANDALRLFPLKHSGYAHGAPVKETTPPLKAQANTRPRSNTAIARSRYSDFASSNTSNYDWFNTVCPSDNRPPLLRSVSEDTPVYQQQQQSTIISSSRLSDSQNRLVMAALNNQQYDHTSQRHGRTETDKSPTSRYDSLPMGERALTAPISHKNDSSTPVSVSEEDESKTVSSPPSERSSSRNASASISSQSSFSTAASSKRSSWCSPLMGVEALPPLVIVPFGTGTPPSQSQPTTSHIPATSAFKPRHSASYSVSAAVPLSRVNGMHPRTSSGTDSRTAFHTSTTSSSAPSSNIGLHEEHRDAGERETSSYLATFDPAVAEAIRQAAASVRSQTGHMSAPRESTAASQQQQRRVPTHTAKQGQSSAAAAADVNMSNMQNSLMGACGNGYFGNAIRAKALEILDELLPSTAYGIEEDEVIGIAEYGSLNSLSSSLIPCITSHFNDASDTEDGKSDARPSFSVTYSDGPGADFRPLMRQVDSTSYEYPHHHLNPQIYSSFAARPFAAQIVPQNSITVGISLMDLHCRRTPTSTGLSAAAAVHNELQAFLTSRAREIKKGGLLLLAFIQRQEDDSTLAVAAGKSKRAGDQDSPDEPNFTSPIGSNTLQSLPGINMSDRRSFPIPSTLTPFPPFTVPDSPASSMQSLSCSLDSSSSLATSLSSPSMARRRSESSPCKPCFKTEQAARRTDIWSTIPSLLAPCIQRLVSTGLIKSDTASHLLTLPLHPRTPSQTRAVLRAVQHQWRTEWACGLPEPSVESSGAVSPSTPTPTSSYSFAQHVTMPETLHAKLDGANASQQRSSYARQGPVREEALVLSHPAYTAYQSTTLSRVQFAEHALQFIRVLYDTHFRTVLRDYAKLSRSRLEEVLDALNDVLREKIEEPGRGLLALELEVCMVALRRV